MDGYFLHTPVTNVKQSFVVIKHVSKLQHFLQVLVYHQQSYSVAEILCKEFSKTEEEISKFRIQKLALTAMDHPFPYGLNVPMQVIKNVSYGFFCFN